MGLEQTQNDKNNPLNGITELLDCKWTLEILGTLQKGSQRYSQIEFAIQGISPSELSARMRQLIRQGVVNRNVQANQPAATNYELTNKGLALQDVLYAIAKYRNIVE